MSSIQPVNDAGGSLTVDGEVSIVQRDASGEIATSDGGHAAGMLDIIDLLRAIGAELRVMNAHLAILTGEDIASVEE